MKKLFAIVFAFILLFIGCKNEGSKKTETLSADLTLDKVEIKYAKGFTIQQTNDFKIITLKHAWKGESTQKQYVLYKDKKPSGFPNAQFVKIPIQSIACMSLTHIAFLDKLGLNESIVAISGCNYVSNEEIIKQINNQQIAEIGQHQQINYEMLIEKQPDIVMAYGIDESSKKHLNKFKELELTVVLNAEYMEKHPLGQAEWLKFVGAFYDEDEKANELFSDIETQYHQLIQLTDTLQHHPTVFVGMPWNGVWYLAGGKSFQAQLLKDAGAHYLWKDNQEFSNFPVDKEVIIDKAMNADYWINLNTYSSIDQVVAYDSKFKEFKAVKNKTLYNNNKRTNQNAGNDYWESGIVNPHVVLKDLIEIFHPQLTVHDLYYYDNLD